MGPLADELGVGSCEVVAFVGAGGKSSLLLVLGAELAAAGHRVVMTTTTKMGEDQVPGWAVVCRTGDDVATALDRGVPVFLVGGIVDGKVTGVTTETVDQMFTDLSIDYVLVEADGARGRSLKAPAPHEPVIPVATTLVVVVAGIDAIGGAIADVAHRPERVAALAGRTVDDRVRPVDMARVLSRGGCQGAPATAQVMVALTKVTPGPPAVAAEAIADLLDGTQIVRVAIISPLSRVPTKALRSK